MPYATVQEMIDRLGAREATALSDRAGVGTPDTAALQRVLDDASAEMDGYLGRRYALPLASRAGVVLSTTPVELRTACIDIARYRMTGTEVMETEGIRVRFKDAIAWLQAAAEGRVQIAAGNLLLASPGNPAAVGGASAVRTPARTFGALEGML
jgi:phage gp36-like protein